MANVCMNYVEVSAMGDDAEEQVKELVALVGKKFDFNKIIPLEFKDSAEESRKYWGCSSISFDTKYGKIGDWNHEWIFWTKWCPPTFIYEKLKEMFPDVYIYWRYEEPSMNIYGFLQNE